MKNFDLTSMGVHEMDLREMQETDGGIIWFIVVAAVALCGGCTINNNNNFGNNNTIINSSTQKVDTSFNGISVDSTLNGNTLDPGFVPIQK
jgi:hypothetical protein